jgi:hypothetical protein
MNVTTKIGVAALVVISLVAALAFANWRRRISRGAAPPAQAVIVRDRSDSQLGGCDRVAGMSQELIAAFPFTDGSAIALFVTGDDRTAGEPVLALAVEVPTTKRVIEGKSVVTVRRAALVEKLREACRAAGQTTQSPIYLAVRRAVEYARAHGCDGRNECVVYVQSDLEELSEKSVRDSIRKAPNTHRRNIAPLPTRIDNKGIDVKICGLAETAGTVESSDKRRTLTPKHDAQRADEIVNVWQKLFTNPNHVVFNSHCPKASDD